MRAIWEFKVYDAQGRHKAFELQAPSRPFAVDRGKRLARVKAPEAVAFECKLLKVVTAE